MRSIVAFFALLSATFAYADSLSTGFQSPPNSAKPWVYWFWLNGNINRQGITADLEAMARVGIGGVLIMETDQGAPLGSVPFAGKEWISLFGHVLKESKRLGIQVNMNDDAGWCGSGGPWIKPEQSMKKVVWSVAQVQGRHKQEMPSLQQIDMPQPETIAGFYRDIALIAFPTPGSFRIPDIAAKAGFVRGGLAPPSSGTAPIDSIIDPSKIVVLDKGAQLNSNPVWAVPDGKWTVMRIGYTSTGRVNLPAPASGTGLECDKLSKEGAEAAFNGFIGKLPKMPGTFVKTHIDSWEIGSQNWTEKFASEFRRRRGYDIVTHLPTLAGYVIGNLEKSERFLWDVRQTISDLVLENYAGHMQTLAKKRGIGLSIEAYGDICVDDLAYAGRVDEPMSEFWTWGGSMDNPETRSEAYLFEMASAAHVYGKPILGAEAFTSNDAEKWLHHPATIKGLGDWQFSRGVNRFVFHRYALTPWIQVKPGMSMGPWGLHYERGNTWWELSSPWHTYLARCQYLLQQGVPVADVLYLAPEGAPSSFIPPYDATHGKYRADACPPDALMRLASVKNRMIVFPGGMSYRVLVLPPGGYMTVPLLKKVAALVKAGATVVGTRPTKSPSLSFTDPVVARLASDTRIGDRDAEDVLRRKGVPPDFDSDRALSAMHRQIGDTDVYFVANSRPVVANAVCSFRVTGKTPEIWNPETGSVERAASFRTGGGLTTVPLALGPRDSRFVVFRKTAVRVDPVDRVNRNGTSVWTRSAQPLSKIVVKRALWGPLGDEKRTKDVTAQVQRIIDRHTGSFQVAELAAEGDPALNIVKTLRLEMSVDGKPVKVSATDPEMVSMPMATDRPLVADVSVSGSTMLLSAIAPGSYEAITKNGRRYRATVQALPKVVSVDGPWNIVFGPSLKTTFGQLISWSDASVLGIRFFSGTATYRKTVVAPSSLFGRNLRQTLDLGKVEAYARVELNGKDLGILWRPPFGVDITGVLRPGKNDLEIQVTNLWPNRMIGDETLPEDSDRNPNGTLKQWPDWLLAGKTSPTGRQTFSSWKLWSKGDKLLPSGLLGPVTIQPSARILMRGRR